LTRQFPRSHSDSGFFSEAAPAPIMKKPKGRAANHSEKLRATMKRGEHPQNKPGMSKTKLVLGAAGLLLFIVGVRKTFGPEGGQDRGGRVLDRDALHDDGGE